MTHVTGIMSWNFLYRFCDIRKVPYVTKFVLSLNTKFFLLSPKIGSEVCEISSHNDLMIPTVSKRWWQNHLVGDFFNLKVVTNISRLNINLHVFFKAFSARLFIASLRVLAIMIFQNSAFVESRPYPQKIFNHAGCNRSLGLS